MHLWLGASGVLLLVLGGTLTLRLLPRRLPEGGRGWSCRRTLQFAVLAAPVVSLSLALAWLHHFTADVCYLEAPPWDQIAGAALPLAMLAVALGAFGLGLARLLLFGRVVTRGSLAADAELQALAEHLAARLGAPQPQVRLRLAGRPLALAYGLRRPTVLLSTWMVDHLDRHELEAVLAHEVAHLARRDFLVVALATMLRDAFCYLPTSWAAHRQLQQEKELACDELAVDVTRRPLALASALARVWTHAVGLAALEAAPMLVGAGEAIEARIERLLTTPAGHPPAPARPRVASLAVGVAALVGLLTLQAINLLAALAALGCAPPLH